MKLVVQRLDARLHLFLDHQNVLGRLVWLLPLVGTDVHEELCDLVRVLAWRRNFDWTSPVEIEMAESVSQVLQLMFSQVGVILRNVEVSRKDAPLSRRGRRQKEIELLRI